MTERGDVTPLPSLKRAMVLYSRRVWERGWVANHDGNLTVRLPANKTLATPTAFCKGDVTESDLLVLDKAGKRLEGRWKPFGELNLHMVAYRARPDVGAVLHAHPPIATGFSCVGVDVETTIIAEAVVSLGARIPTVPYAMPGSEAQLEALAKVLPWFDAVLLGSHGVLTVGKDLEQAYLRMELVEHLARIQQAAISVGRPRSLPEKDVERLLQKRKEAGLGPEARGLGSPPP